MGNSADDKSMIFFLFFPENRICYFMQISLKETVCMKCLILFPGENKKKIFQNVAFENFTQSSKPSFTWAIPWGQRVLKRLCKQPAHSVKDLFIGVLSLHLLEPCLEDRGSLKGYANSLHILLRICLLIYPVISKDSVSKWWFRLFQWNLKEIILNYQHSCHLNWNYCSAQVNFATNTDY